tara:strand:+ start:1169 stop:1768 length:600 start_codon:yes stop_codon:yes gene_type:complete
MNISLKETPCIYINLDDQPERRTSMESFFERNEIVNYRRSPGVRVYGEHPRHGINQAFLNAFDMGFEEFPDKPFIIFEDDVTERRCFTTEINVPDDYDAIYLGISAWGRMNGESGPHIVAESVDDNVYRIGNMLAAHAILYNVNYAKTCYELVKEARDTGEYHDVAYANNMGNFNVYCLKNPIVYQTSSRGVTDLEIQK